MSKKGELRISSKLKPSRPSAGSCTEVRFSIQHGPGPIPHGLVLARQSHHNASRPMESAHARPVQYWVL